MLVLIDPPARRWRRGPRWAPWRAGSCHSQHPTPASRSRRDGGEPCARPRHARRRPCRLRPLSCCPQLLGLGLTHLPRLPNPHPTTQPFSTEGVPVIGCRTRRAASSAAASWSPISAARTRRAYVPTVRLVPPLHLPHPPPRARVPSPLPAAALSTHLHPPVIFQFPFHDSTGLEKTSRSHPSRRCVYACLDEQRLHTVSPSRTHAFLGRSPRNPAACLEVMVIHPPLQSANCKLQFLVPRHKNWN